MDEEKTEQVLSWFLELESRFLEFTKHLPYNDSSKDVPMPLLAGIIIESSSLIDTIFRNE